ncbi:MAG: CZB domain-containing protein [Rubrivivax sp.]|nr:CZB domain-containing protein [Rubrivivax sp.]
MNLDDAIKAHGEWKLKLRRAIQDRQQLDAASISRDNVCPFGQWLHGAAKTQYGRLRTYSACVEKHAAFHREAGRVAQTINAGEYAVAEKMLDGGTPYAAASSAIGGAILGLRKEVATTA